MKQLLILSGKGGTGKTTLASAFIRLSNAKAYADADVDAPNLHLALLNKNEPQTEDFYGMAKAVIDPDKCTNCGLCKDHCRFNAIEVKEKHQVNEFACEGCGVCGYVCPSDAISYPPYVVGKLALYKEDAVFSTAKLKMGSGNSGLLVTRVKTQLRDHAGDAEFAIIDGSPGIGCPVIASISGVDMVLVVTEPTVSGISDLERIVATSKGFGVKIGVIINKYDINEKNTENIEKYCNEHQLPMIAKIPFDKQAVKAVNNYLTIVDIQCKAGEAAKEAYENTMKLLMQN